MQLTVEGLHMDVGDNLRAHVNDTLIRITEKYFPNPIQATVVFTKEKQHLFHVDIKVHAATGIDLRASARDGEAYACYDAALSRVDKRLARYKDKLKDHHRDGADARKVPYYTFAAAINDDEDAALSEAEGGTEPVVIAEMEQSIPTLAVADAVMRLEIGDLPALMFKNPAHGELNMVFRRKDGNIGWVDPGGEKKKKA